LEVEMPGLHVKRKGVDSPGFWYDHPAGMGKKQFIRDTLLSHVELYCREQVKVDGVDVVREIPPTDLIVAYGSRLVVGGDGNAVLENPEPVDVLTAIRG
jgi:hypothetical protein